MKRILSFALATAFALFSSAHAVVVSGTVTGGSAFDAGGVFVELSTPFFPPNGNTNEVGQDTFQTPNLYAFNENQNIVAPDMIEVNIGNDVMAGQIVASHYVFFDPGPSQTMQGCVTFDAQVYGIITNTALLAASDYLQNNDVEYLNPSARGLESNDSAWIDSNDANTICVDFRASSPGDFIRVLTMESPNAAVPLPAAGVLFLAGLTGLGATRRFGRRA